MWLSLLAARFSFYFAWLLSGTALLTLWLRIGCTDRVLNPLFSMRAWSQRAASSPAVSATTARSRTRAPARRRCRRLPLSSAYTRCIVTHSSSASAAADQVGSVQQRGRARMGAVWPVPARMHRLVEPTGPAMALQLRLPSFVLHRRGTRVFSCPCGIYPGSVTNSVGREGIRREDAEEDQDHEEAVVQHPPDQPAQRLLARLLPRLLPRLRKVRPSSPQSRQQCFRRCL